MARLVKVNVVQGERASRDIVHLMLAGDIIYALFAYCLPRIGITQEGFES